MDPARPDPWRVCYSLHGLGPGQPPIPAGEYRAALGWFAAVWDVATVARGLRLAASIPPAHGSGVRPAVLEALADAWAARARGVAA